MKAGGTSEPWTDAKDFHKDKRTGYMIFWAGVTGGLTNLVCGISVGIIGSGASHTETQ